MNLNLPCFSNSFIFTIILIIIAIIVYMQTKSQENLESHEVFYSITNDTNKDITLILNEKKYPIAPFNTKNLSINRGANRRGFSYLYSYPQSPVYKTKNFVKKIRNVKNGGHFTIRDLDINSDSRWAVQILGPKYSPIE